MARKRKTRKLSDNMLYKERIPTKEERYKDIWDSSCSGFFARIGRTSIVFYCYNSLTRKTHRLGAWHITSHGGLSTETARDRARVFLADNTGTTDISRITLSKYLELHYMTDRADTRRPVRQETINKIKIHFADWLDKRVNQITNAMLVEKVADWRAGTHTIRPSHHNHKHPKAKPNTNASIRRKFVMINAVFNMLVTNDHLQKNPLKRPADIKTYKKPDHVHVYHEDVTYEAVLDFILNQDRPTDGASKYRKNHTRTARVLIATIIRLGLRDSEARCNFVNSFVLDNETNSYLSIPSSICKTGEKRNVPITDPVLIAALIDYRDNHHVHNKQGLMFYNSSTGKEVTHACGLCLYKELVEEFKLGVNGNGSGRKYDFRHTFATRLYRDTGDIKLVADVIGDSIETADAYYAQKDTERARDSIAKMR